MARKKGRDVNGWLIVDKPGGVTSTAVVAKVRWALDAKKAGHAGTLDPDATGVLAVALGEATKTVATVTDALKCYDFTVTWGAETATDDASGEVVRASDARPDRAARVMSLVRQTRGGRDYDPDWSQRMKGTGPVAELVATRFKAAAKRYGLDGPRPLLDESQFRFPPDARPQMDLFDLPPARPDKVA